MRVLNVIINKLTWRNWKYSDWERGKVCGWEYKDNTQKTFGCSSLRKYHKFDIVDVPISSMHKPLVCNIGVAIVAKKWCFGAEVDAEVPHCHHPRQKKLPNTKSDASKIFQYISNAAE